jgi:hypothetical protein
VTMHPAGIAAGRGASWRKPSDRIGATT